MHKILLTALIQLSVTLGFAQNGEELNKKSKEYLDKKDLKNAVPLIRQAAEGGNAEAQYNLGVSYQQGLEVPQNDSLANSWFLKAAQQGWKDAQFKMAFSYATGRGVMVNYDQSFFWSVKCAEQQDVECMYNVAGCYMQGRGTQKNMDSMLVWAERIALMHTPEDLQISGKITSVRVYLATLYRDGENVTKDLVKSYMWFLVYNESKKDLSILEQQKNIEAIKELDKQLSKTQKDKAKLDAEKLLGKPLKNIANLNKQDL